MMNYIFVPNSKPFIFPCITLQNFLTQKGEDSILIVSDSMQHIFSKFKLRHILESQWESCIVEEETAGLICFHHASDEFYSRFKDRVVRLTQTTNKLKVSFFPDGFGNAIWGKNFYKRLTDSDEKLNKIVSLEKVFCFGIVHSTCLKEFDKKNIEVLDYKLVSDFFDNCEPLKNIVLTAINSLTVKNDLVLIPYRPWCTSGFHGGIYNFGTTEQLAKAYHQLLSLVTPNIVDRQVLFRGDERFMPDCASITTYFEQDENFSDIGFSTYPSWLTLEPIVYHLVKSGLVGRLQLITLDSATFQPLVFLLSEFSDAVDIISHIGCTKMVLESLDGSEFFVEKKLKIKISDFVSRYRSFEQQGIVSSVIQLDDCFFSVRL